MQTGQSKLKMSSPENISPPEGETSSVLSKLSDWELGYKHARISEFWHSTWHTAGVCPYIRDKLSVLTDVRAGVLKIHNHAMMSWVEVCSHQTMMTWHSKCSFNKLGVERPKAFNWSVSLNDMFGFGQRAYLCRDIKIISRKKRFWRDACFILRKQCHLCLHDWTLSHLKHIFEIINLQLCNIYIYIKYIFSNLYYIFFMSLCVCVCLYINNKIILIVCI